MVQYKGAYITWSFDGASENTVGDGDAFCGASSPFHQMFISRDIWKHVDAKLDKAAVAPGGGEIESCSRTGRGIRLQSHREGVALGHRTNGAEFELERFSMQFLNPNWSRSAGEKSTQGWVRRWQ